MSLKSPNESDFLGLCMTRLCNALLRTQKCTPPSRWKSTEKPLLQVPTLGTDTFVRALDVRFPSHGAPQQTQSPLHPVTTLWKDLLRATVWLRVANVLRKCCPMAQWISLGCLKVVSPRSGFVCREARRKRQYMWIFILFRDTPSSSFVPIDSHHLTRS